jgi:hypothetical protein
MNMRGDERVQDGMFSHVWLEQRVPVDHPLRGIRKLTDTVLWGQCGVEICSNATQFKLKNAESSLPACLFLVDGERSRIGF